MPSLDGAMENPQHSFCVGNGSANLYVQGAHSNCPSAGTEKGNPPILPVDKDLSVPKSSPHFSSLFYSIGGKSFSCGRSPGARSPIFQRNKSISFGKKGRGGNSFPLFARKAPMTFWKEWSAVFCIPGASQGAYCF